MKITISTMKRALQRDVFCRSLSWARFVVSDLWSRCRHMSSRSTPAKLRVRKTSPLLLITDIERTCRICSDGPKAKFYDAAISGASAYPMTSSARPSKVRGNVCQRPWPCSDFRRQHHGGPTICGVERRLQSFCAGHTDQGSFAPEASRLTLPSPVSLCHNQL
jgi:hypothetical protein